MREEQPDLTPLQPSPAPQERRRRVHARLRQDGLDCDCGRVLDLSHGGMRLESARVSCGTFDVTIDDGESSLTVRAEVVWSKRLGFRRFEIGLQFIDLTDEMKSALTRIAMTNRGRRTIGDEPPRAAA